VDVARVRTYTAYTGAQYSPLYVTDSSVVQPECTAADDDSPQWPSVAVADWYCGWTAWYDDDIIIIAVSHSLLYVDIHGDSAMVTALLLLLTLSGRFTWHCAYHIISCPTTVCHMLNRVRSHSLTVRTVAQLLTDVTSSQKPTFATVTLHIHSSAVQTGPLR